jgi:hypothetical protein
MNDSGDVAFVFGLKPFTPSSLRGFVNAGLYRYSCADQRLSAVDDPQLLRPGVFQSPASTPASTTPAVVLERSVCTL